MNRTTLLSSLLFLCGSLFANTSALDKSVEVMEQNSICATFVYSNSSLMGLGLEDFSGSIIVDKERFRILSEEVNIWFDGSTLWSYLPDNGPEIYISSPTPEELAFLNPYLVLKERSWLSITDERSKDNLIQIDLSVRQDSGNGIPAAPLPDMDKVTVTLNAVTSLPEKIEIISDDDESMVILLRECRLSKETQPATFICPEEEYPQVEFIDMR